MESRIIPGVSLPTIQKMLKICQALSELIKLIPLVLASFDCCLGMGCLPFEMNRYGFNLTQDCTLWIFSKSTFCTACVEIILMNVVCTLH